MYDEAIADFQKAGKQFGPKESPGLIGRLGRAYAISGRIADANRLLQELESQPVPAGPEDPLLPPPGRAMGMGPIHLGLGNIQLALEWLEKAADERDAGIIHLKYDPVFSSIRGEPAYKALLQRQAWIGQTMETEPVMLV